MFICGLDKTLSCEHFLFMCEFTSLVFTDVCPGFFFFFLYSSRITLQVRDSNKPEPTGRVPLKKRKSEVCLFLNTPQRATKMCLCCLLICCFCFCFFCFFNMQVSKKRVQPAAKKQSYEIQVSVCVFVFVLWPLPLCLKLLVTTLSLKLRNSQYLFTSTLP